MKLFIFSSNNYGFQEGILQTTVDENWKTILVGKHKHVILRWVVVVIYIYIYVCIHYINVQYVLVHGRESSKK